MYHSLLPALSYRFLWYINKSHATELKTRVRTQFLSPQITYTVNLVFKIADEDKENIPKHYLIRLSYRLKGDAKASVSYLADKREDGCYMLELYQFTSDQRSVDLEITFYDHWYHLKVEGIEFRPLEKVGHKVLEDKVDMQPIPDADDTCWEKKLPKDYQDIIKWSTDGIRWTTKKELYYILCEGFLINNGEAWFSVDKSGNNCQMLSARSSMIINRSNPIWLSFPESRFGEVVILDSWKFSIVSEIKSQVLSPRARYASYLVYKLPEEGSENEGPLEVRYKDLGSDDWKVDNSWYIYLVSPQTPVIRPKSNQNAYNSVSRPKIKGIPQQRSDGWMEVQVWEFQTSNITKMIHMGVDLAHSNHKPIHGVFVQGVELRPI
ncbi:putative phloem protein [Helianthus debilis subsp. tardiflorus]